MGTGYLSINARTYDEALPVANAKVTIKETNGNVLYQTKTDENGKTDYFPLQAPDVRYTLDPDYHKPAYAVYDVDVNAPGFITEHIHNVEVVDTQSAYLPVEMKPMAIPAIETDEDIYIPDIGLLSTEQNRKIAPFDIAARAGLRPVIIPDYITVHLGRPTAAARNIRVRFSDYVKNVASSEIYSTWPTNSLIANIHAIVTFALNRVYTEWYRSRGYNFDITNSTSFDMAYREGGPIFTNISNIVDGIYNVYARRYGFENPFFTQFCNGSTVTCPGLSQWGTVTLAKAGVTKNPLKNQIPYLNGIIA